MPSDGVSVLGLRVAVTGATGFVGTALVRALRDGGARPLALVRDPEKARRLLGVDVEAAEWDIDRPERSAWKGRLAEVDAVVHLAGVPLFERRWTESFKAEILKSRVEGTRSLVTALLEDRRARGDTRGDEARGVFVSASAVGFYGTDPALDAHEETPAASDFLASVCTRWEAEAAPLRGAGFRVVHTRLGIVLGTESGALPQMIPLFRFGVGGVLGRSDPWIDWIHRDDAVGILVKAVADASMVGPYNAVAPNPARNAEFSRAIGRAMRRPTLFRYPAALLRVGIGEAADFLSGGARVRADRILAAGYRFAFPDLDGALDDLLGSRARPVNAPSR